MISQIVIKNVTNQKLSKQTNKQTKNKIQLKSRVTFLAQKFFFKICMIFKKDRVKWQHTVVNPTVNHNIFLNYSTCSNTLYFPMSFLDNLSEWKM